MLNVWEVVLLNQQWQFCEFYFPHFTLMSFFSCPFAFPLYYLVSSASHAFSTKLTHPSQEGPNRSISLPLVIASLESLVELPIGKHVS